MNIDKNRLERYLNGEASPEDQQLIEAWYAQLGSDASVDEQQLEAVVSRMDARLQEEGLLLTAGEEPKKAKIRPIWYSVAAAAVLLIVGFYFFRQGDEQVDEKQQLAAIKAPQGTNSIIVLEDKSEVELDKLKQQDTIQADGYRVYRNESGELIYQIDSTSTKLVYNTIRTKAGGMTSIKLSDGTKVWINSNAELRYPVAFAENIREVSLSGEAYFEVEKDASRPFYVRSSQHTIKVLGTRFNVQDYNDQYTSTLLAGKIALANQHTEIGASSEVDFPIILQPKQSYDGQSVRNEERPEKAIDWKEGYFDFSDMTLDAAATKLSNWYGVTIEVTPNLKEQRIYGQIGRDRSLGEVMDILSKVIPIKYSLNNKRVLITNLN